MLHDTDVLILGGGVTGLAAAHRIGTRAIVLEREARPGGLVRTDAVDGYWFDHVLHLLHFSGDGVKTSVRELLGEVLAPCPPVAWVETAAGHARYPIQHHLGALAPDAAVRCLHDLAQVTFAPAPPVPDNFEDFLQQSFGAGLCDLFLFPYNRKLWKRPLRELAPTGFTWNVVRPSFETAARGALAPDAASSAYNADGWYPRPAAGAPCRGMEVLVRALAAEVSHLLTGRTVVRIDPSARIVTATHGPIVERYRYRRACLATIPLPATIALCADAGPSLVSACSALPRNRVVSLMFGIRGPRPANRGQWRYYADETLIFHRLVYLHEFDPAAAPADGWALLAEVSQRAEDPLEDERALRERVIADLHRAGALPPDSAIVLARQRVIDPAYVVFAAGTEAVVTKARSHLAERDITPLGRYGRWEYSSIAQNMRDAFAWAEGLIDGADASIAPPAAARRRDADTRVLS